jgi:hypothetical protein
VDKSFISPWGLTSHNISFATYIPRESGPFDLYSTESADRILVCRLARECANALASVTTPNLESPWSKAAYEPPLVQPLGSRGIFLAWVPYRFFIFSGGVAHRFLLDNLCV